MLMGGITLDLNGHSLKFTNFVAFNSNNVVDNSINKGILLNSSKIMLAKNNSQIPIKVQDSYAFVRMNMQQTALKLIDTGFSFILRPDFENESISNDSLVKVGAEVTRTNTKGDTVSQGFI